MMARRLFKTTMVRLVVGVCFRNLLTSLSRGHSEVFVGAQGPLAWVVLPLLLHLQKNGSSTFSLLYAKLPRKILQGKENSGIKLRKMQNCYRNKENEKEISRESFRQNKPDLSAMEI